MTHNKRNLTPWQTNYRRGWLCMSAYWVVGAAVGISAGYKAAVASRLANATTKQFVTRWHIVALFVTLLLQLQLLKRYESFGRERSYLAVAVFSLLNGTFETMMFLASHDVGRKFATEYMGLPVSSAVVFGFCIFCCYCALIHIFFWIPCAFPQNECPEAPPFHTHGLPALTLISMAWIGLYEATGDIASVCVLHALTDALLAARISLPLPIPQTKSESRRCLDPADLKNNVRATGSDVVSVYVPSSSADKTREEKKVYIVTGATSGLGKHTSILLANKAGFHVILAVRDIAKGHEVVENAIKPEDGSAEVMYLDLASLDSIRAFAERFRSTNRLLHGLVNNAGVYGLKGNTADGFQTTWQTNCMGPALLTELLLPCASHDFRVVNVTSELGRLVHSVKDKCPPMTSGAGFMDYALSKACQVLHAHDLMLQFAASSQRAFAVEPGIVKTRISRHTRLFGRWFHDSVLVPLLSRTLDEGCSTIMFCLLAPLEDLDRISTDPARSEPFYYADCAPKKPTKCFLSIEEVESQRELFQKLWNLHAPAVHDSTSNRDIVENFIDRYDPAKAWTKAAVGCLAYWLMAHFVGTTKSVFTEPPATAEQLSDFRWLLLLVLSIAAVLVSYGVVWPASTLVFDRRRYWGAQVIFGLIWGSGTGLWLGSMYRGVARLFKDSKPLIWTISFFLVSMWQALINGYFWSVYVIPEHDTPESNRHKVLTVHVPQFVVNLSFLVLYENVTIFVCLQCLALVFASVSLRMPPWWEQRPNMPARTKPGLFGLPRSAGWVGALRSEKPYYELCR